MFRCDFVVSLPIKATGHSFKLIPNIILTQSKSSVSPIVCVSLVLSLSTARC